MINTVARILRPVLSVGVLLTLSACGWAQWPPPGNGPMLSNRPSSSNGFINATAVTVGKGDTVYSIARRHQLSPRDIIDANNLRPPYELEVGQRLVLPSGREHTVQRGEYLALIAKRYQTDAFSIARVNGIRSPYTIYPGQKLRIPRNASSSASAHVSGTETSVASAPAPSFPPSSSSSSSTSSPPPPSSSETVTPTRAKSTPQAKTSVPEPPKRSGGKFSWPIEGKLLSSYGSKDKGMQNDGINIAAPRGATVKAAENGVVAYAGNEIRGFGNLLLIKHDDGWVTAYAHNDELLVKRGDKVSRGQIISKVGSTGSVTSPQLHFELRKGATAVDPKKYLM